MWEVVELKNWLATGVNEKVAADFRLGVSPREALQFPE
jgi:hypothetical protein